MAEDGGVPPRHEEGGSRSAKEAPKVVARMTRFRCPGSPTIVGEQDGSGFPAGVALATVGVSDVGQGLFRTAARGGPRQTTVCRVQDDAFISYHRCMACIAPGNGLEILFRATSATSPIPAAVRAHQNIPGKSHGDDMRGGSVRDVGQQAVAHAGGNGSALPRVPSIVRGQNGGVSNGHAGTGIDELDGSQPGIHSRLDYLP